MTLSTDELRAALDDAASAPFDGASSARLSGVRARVRQRQRRRAGAAVGAATVAVVTVVAVAIGGSAGDRPDRLTPATPSRTSTPAAALAPLPLLYRGQDVVAQLSGADDENAAKEVTFPSGASGAIVVRCAAPKGEELPAGTSVQVVPVLPGAVDPEGQVPVTCLGGGEPADGTILDTVDLKAGATVRVMARFDRGVPAGATFSVALLAGDDVIDLSPLRKAPAGYAFIQSFALSDGWLYASGTADDGPTPTSDPVVGGAQVAMENQRSVHLLVNCVGRQRLVADVGDGEQQTVDCPADQRVTRTVDLTLQPSAQQRLRLQVQDADPGALVEVGVSSR